MVDRITRKHRSWNMSRITSKNTAPELAVRSVLHKLGYRYRLHGKDLPGNPDIVLPRHKTVVFVHGCFWHRHARCRYTYSPKSNQAAWNRKFRENVARDRSNVRALRALGWRIVVIWQCRTERLEVLQQTIRKSFSILSSAATVKLRG